MGYDSMVVHLCHWCCCEKVPCVHRYVPMSCTYCILCIYLDLSYVVAGIERVWPMMATAIHQRFTGRAREIAKILFEGQLTATIIIKITTNNNK